MGQADRPNPLPPPTADSASFQASYKNDGNDLQLYFNKDHPTYTAELNLAASARASIKLKHIETQLGQAHPSISTDPVNSNYFICHSQRYDCLLCLKYVMVLYCHILCSHCTLYDCELQDRLLTRLGVYSHTFAASITTYHVTT